MRRRIRTLLHAMALAWASAAQAGEGQLEIHQACVAAGCFEGDAPGFPVTLAVSGSYRLTSHLVVPDADTTAIEFGPDADRSTLDLAGFTLFGPNTCSPLLSSCTAPGAGQGIATHSGTSDVTLRDGRIVGMGDHGVHLRSRSFVRGVSAQGNGGVGIAVGPFSSVLDSQSIQNGSGGIRVEENASGTQFDNAGRSLLRGNLAVENGVLDGAPDLEGGRDGGGNVCSDARCAGRQRRYFLTTQPVLGSDAGSNCGDGFHVASVWELANPSALLYEDRLGFDPDAGTGPPAGVPGWAYVDPAGGHCADFTGSGTGSTLELERDAALQDVGPWDVSSGASCTSTQRRVWCVEDR